MHRLPVCRGHINGVQAIHAHRVILIEIVGCMYTHIMNASADHRHDYFPAGSAGLVVDLYGLFWDVKFPPMDLATALLEHSARCFHLHLMLYVLAKHYFTTSRM